ncbi:hypothetical protein [Merismopedia glauca]|uniref:hypothetical protein n=1 Tax=Merismopedia glauca TaxID=292586 RepID=UPI0015E77025|nr:hypothetical protein [Merismopedia glauca]
MAIWGALSPLFLHRTDAKESGGYAIANESCGLRGNDALEAVFEENARDVARIGGS